MSSQAFPNMRNYCAHFNCVGKENLKHFNLRKAWDETSHEGRHWVDTLARTYDLNILAREGTFDVCDL